MNCIEGFLTTREHMSIMIWTLPTEMPGLAGLKRSRVSRGLCTDHTHTHTTRTRTRTSTIRNRNRVYIHTHTTRHTHTHQHTHNREPCCVVNNQRYIIPAHLVKIAAEDNFLSQIQTSLIKILFVSNSYQSYLSILRSTSDLRD